MIFWKDHLDLEKDQLRSKWSKLIFIPPPKKDLENNLFTTLSIMCVSKCRDDYTERDTCNKSGGGCKWFVDPAGQIRLGETDYQISDKWCDKVQTMDNWSIWFIRHFNYLYLKQKCVALFKRSRNTQCSHRLQKSKQFFHFKCLYL